MTMLSPSATFHAELREQLGGVGRALSFQRGLVWLARGLAVGSFAVLLMVVWAWSKDQVSLQSIPLYVSVPLGMAIAFGVGSLFLQHEIRELARRIDRAAGLEERSITALELGARGEEFPLALAQMRDAVEHLRRVDLLDTFPLRLPKRELLTTFFVVVVAALIGISPNPWLLRQRAANPAISIAREQAQRVERLAESIRAEDSPELDPLRELLRKGARTVDARSNEPDDALNALEDLEAQVQQMSAGDDQLAAALAAIASALSSDPATQNLASAINTGDLREVSKAAKDLAQRSDQLTGQEQQRVGRVLRDASNRAGRASPSVAGELADAAAAMQQAGDGSDANSTDATSGTQQMKQGSTGQPGAAPNGRTASQALDELSNNAAAASERQRAASQLEASRNALERSLGRTQSRSASSGRSTSSSSAGSRGQNPGTQGDAGQGASQGQGTDPSSTGDQGQGGGQSGEDSGTGDSGGDGSGYSTGGQNQNRTGVSGLDTITRPEQVPNSGGFSPDESAQNPYLNDSAPGAANASDESVQPSFTRKPTQGNDSSSIPLGLRDLVKDYFSSLDQK
jgi:hypothetical protein